MVGKTAPITKADQRRLEIITKHCGCLCCVISGHLYRAATVEHVTDGGRRVEIDDKSEHQCTIGLCEWHHFGALLPGQTRQGMVGTMGPSLAWGRIPFEEFYGDEVNVLIPCQDYFIKLFEASPWLEYDLPRKAARELRLHWTEIYHAAILQSNE